jgi:hypothetical protein
MNDRINVNTVLIGTVALCLVMLGKALYQAPKPPNTALDNLPAGVTLPAMNQTVPLPVQAPGCKTPQCNAPKEVHAK